MPDKKVRTLASAVILAMACVSCQQPIGSEASVKPNIPSTVKRPQDLPLDKVEPCRLFTPEQQRAFAIDAPGRPTENEFFDNGPMCNYPSWAQLRGFSFTLIKNKGIDFFVEKNVNAELRDLDIRGFAGRELFTPVSPELDVFCTVVVDVAREQVLHTMFRETGEREPRLARDEACAKAKQGAEAAVTTLMAMR